MHNSTMLPNSNNTGITIAELIVGSDKSIRMVGMRNSILREKKLQYCHLNKNKIRVRLQIGISCDKQSPIQSLKITEH